MSGLPIFTRYKIPTWLVTVAQFVIKLYLIIALILGHEAREKFVGFVGKDDDYVGLRSWNLDVIAMKSDVGEQQ